MYRSAIKTLLTATFLFVVLLVKAQLTANFSISTAQGCSPLKTSFTDLCAGTSSNTVYSWDLGNGNTSVLKNPSATYITEGTYNIKLTVKDGNQTSSIIKEVRVYKKPQPDFNFSPVKGCSPFEVKFNSTSTPGDGSLTNYIWDFGDGSTEQTNNPSINHIYQTAQKATVSLTAVNHFGCYNTITKKDIIDVLPALIPDFTVDQTVLCRISDQVQFTNKTIGPGTLTYLWNFGDGTTSADKDPKHVFTQKGIYTITLTVTSSEGCSAVKTLQNFVNAASYKADFDVSTTQACTGSMIDFTRLSTPEPVDFKWTMGDGNTFYYFFSFRHIFYNEGEYPVQLINTFGNGCKDTVVKTIKVNPIPVLSGFLDTLIGGVCGPPAQINLKDTSTNIVKREWYKDYFTSQPLFLGSSQSLTVNINQNSNTAITLVGYNAYGCKSTVSKGYDVFSPWVGIVPTYSSAGGYSSEACSTLTMKFRSETQSTITSYKWMILDSLVSTNPTLEFTFSKPGNYFVKLEYTTTEGCKGTAYYNYITVYPKVINDFTSVSGTKICGNSVVTFRSTPDNNPPHQTWYINGQYAGSSWYNSFQYQFQQTGKYTVMMITFNGRCTDTVVKTDYIEVVPPFAKIDRSINTCEGSRTAVRFIDGSREVQSWTWNFGDGKTTTYTSPQTEIVHDYGKSGIYKVVLAVTNGTCTVKDSVEVKVFAKQSPKLIAVTPHLCADQPLTINLSNIDPTPIATPWNGTYFEKFEYEDGTPFRGTIDNYLYNFVLYPIPGNFTLRNFDAGKKQLRVITRSPWHNCFDTSNFIPIQINGASAGFEVVKDNQCYQTPVVLRDTSKASGNNSIVSWEWNFGDGKVETRTQGGTISHLYENPGNYTVTLKVKDAAGCISTFTSYSRIINVKGPKADFNASSTNVPLNSVVYFFNSTNTWGAGNVIYKWDFGNGVTSTDAYPFHQYTVAGEYIVTLTATDPSTGCTSTATKKITVRNFNSAFSFTSSFAASSSCPPVVTRFVNTSVGYVSVSWDFGDGTTAGNVNYPSHIYSQPGKYIIKLFVFGDNGLKGTFIDSVLIKGVSAKPIFNPKEACSSQQISFKAGSSVGISNYLWDFGDGTFFSSADSTAVHFYKSPGVYTPTLLGINEDGCTVAVPSTEKIIIDSLSVDINGIPAQACNEANIQFKADVFSVGAANDPGFLRYKWSFGTRNPADTSNAANPIFKYNSPGTYTVSLTVNAKSGCIKQISKTVVINQSSKGSITAPASVCEGSTVLFKGTASITSGVQWNWNFNNGQIAAVQNPSAQLYSKAGIYSVKLVVNNNGCYDTSTHLLTVHALPNIQLAASTTKLCAGSTTQLNAQGGGSYQWSPVTDLNNPQISSPVASPVINTTYKVTVTTTQGCIKADSVTIRVIQPFQLNTQKNYTVCEGESVSLSVTGASTYQWIGNVQGLSAINSGTITAKPSASTTYNVVGFDAEGCFTDTAVINITVNKRPSVNAGPDWELQPGTPYQLQPTASADVVKWLWTPPDFLSCTQCAAPLSNPKRTTQYIVTVSNAFNCSASDTVVMKILCSTAQVFIPNSFTPNNDGLNDIFKVLGNGASLIKAFRIYDRWGSLVFERKEIRTEAYLRLRAFTPIMYN
jgi:PKD repeat protein